MNCTRNPSSRFVPPLLLSYRTDAAIPGAAVVWHDATKTRRLLLERRVHAETEARRALLQTILDELPSSVYLVRGPEARLVLANRAAATVWGAVWPVGQPMASFCRSSTSASVDGHQGLQ